MQLKRNLHETGDTIVEVLIAIAVLSVVLGGAFAIANRSLTNITKAQEHTTALKYAEQQIERIKQLADGNNGLDSLGGNIFGPSPASPYCVIINGSNKLQIVNGNQCKFGISPVLYNASVTPTATPVSGSTHSYNFVVKVTWPGINGGTDNVELNYRLNK